MLHSRSDQWHTAMVDLLRAVNLCQPDELPQLVNAVTEQIATRATIYLVDFEQETLRSFTAGAGPVDERPVDGTEAGTAFRRSEVRAERGASDTTMSLWVPLLDGTERLGVLRIEHDEPLTTVGSVGHEPYVEFANLLGHIVASKLPYGDRLQLTQCSRPMSVASVLLRQLLQPLTFTSDRLVIAANLQPPYAVGGDGFDYAVDFDTAYIAIFDAVGHGLDAGLTTAVAMAATRAARREGESLFLMAQSADVHLSAQFDEDHFVTAVLAQLDLVTGVLSVLNAGHPSPIVISETGAAISVDGGRRTPLGIPGPASTFGTHQLQPGDRLLLYTDGVIESRDRDGTFFGVDRLIRMAHRRSSEESPPETARLINQAVFDFHAGSPDDDATVLILDWSTSAADKTLP